MPLPDFDEVIENMDFLDDWEDKYGYVIELGKMLPELPDNYRTSQYKIDGCASQVWLVPEITDTDNDRILSFEGDSDALIVRGLIAVLKILYSGKTLTDIRYIDPQDAMKKIGLAEHLSPQRSNGLNSMIHRISKLSQK